MEVFDNKDEPQLTRKLIVALAILGIVLLLFAASPFFIKWFLF